jgi:hypothetical protein
MDPSTQTANPARGSKPTIRLPDPPEPGQPGFDGRPRFDKTYYENPFKTERHRVNLSDDPVSNASFSEALRTEGGVSRPRELHEILRQQKGFKDLRLSAPLPSSSDRATFKTELGRDQIKARIGLIEKDFVRMAACPEGIERLRMLALVAMDAYQPNGHKYVPRGQAEAAIYDEAKDTWENLCEKSELSDVHYRRRATENLVGTYNGVLKHCQELDKSKGWHFFDSHQAIEVPKARRNVEYGLDGWFDVPTESKNARRNLLGSECWCYEETIGPDGKPRGEIVKRLKPTFGQYALRAMNYVCGCQNSGEFVGALLGTLVGGAISAAWRPYTNSVSEETAEKLVLLGRIKEFPSGPAHEDAERRQQRKNRWRPREGAELRQFVEGANFTMHFPPVAGDGYTMDTPHGQYRVTPNQSFRSRTSEHAPDNTFHHPPPEQDHPPSDGREGSEDRPSL